MPMTKIKVVIDDPILPTGNKVTHTATSYIIGRAPDLSQEANIIEKKLKDTVNKSTVYFNVDVEYGTILYVKCKYHFNVQGVGEKESNWSRVVPVNSLQSGIKLSSSIVKTPIVNYEVKDNLIYIKSTDFIMFAGPGDHHSTDYKITDTDGYELYHRENDEDNLNNIYVKDNLEEGKIYSLKARHNNTTNNSSFYGETLYPKYSPNLQLFTFEAPEDFIINRKFYYRIKIWINKFKSYNLEIRDDDNTVIINLENETKLTNYILLTNEKLVLFKRYHIFIKLNFDNETSTDFKKVASYDLGDNFVDDYNNSVNYANKFIIGKEHNTGGITCCTMRETYDNKIIGVDYKTNSLYLFRIEEYKLVPMVSLYEFKESLNLDYVNIFQLPNHDILVDIVLYNKKRQAYTMFLLFEYDPIKLSLKLIKQKIRYDEKYNTSISNSLVVTNENEIYYIPSYLTDGRNEDRTWLTLRKVDPVTLDIEDIVLPFSSKYFTNIIKDSKDNVYVFGGTDLNHYNTTESGTREEIWINTIKDVHIFNKQSKTFSLYTTLPDTYRNEVYCIQPIYRKDGKVVFFNGCWSGAGLNADDFIVFDPIPKEFTREMLNGKIKVPVRSNIIFKNGEIYRLTSKVEDPQRFLIFGYVKDQEIPDFDDIDKEPLELTVEDNQIVNIEDIYKYTNITIKGSGLLRWYRPQGITELTSQDLIVFKDTKITQATLNGRKYRSILVLDGINFEITAR